MAASHTGATSPRAGDDEATRKPSEASPPTPAMTRRTVFSYALQCVAFLLLAVPVLMLFLQLPRSTSTSPQRLAPFIPPCKLYAPNATQCVPFHRSLFPTNFVFGTATAAYQVPAAIARSRRRLHLIFFSADFPRLVDRSKARRMRAAGSPAFGTHFLDSQVILQFHQQLRSNH
jgi:hypothetical protein